MEKNVFGVFDQNCLPSKFNICLGKQPQKRVSGGGREIPKRFHGCCQQPFYLKRKKNKTEEKKLNQKRSSGGPTYCDYYITIAVKGKLS